MVGARSALFLPYREARPDRRRRGARDQLQAGGRRPISRPRRRGDARQVRAGAGRPRLGHARRSRRRHMAEIGTYRELQAARPLRRRAPARHGGARPASQDPPPRGRWLAPELVDALEANLEAGEQSLLFLNRRGYAPLTLCRHCGYRFQCPNCTAWMVEHRFTRRLACHHCGHVMPRAASLPRMQGGGQPGRLRPRRRADRRRGRARSSPRRAPSIVTSDTIWSPAKAAEFVAPDGGGRDRHRHRHPAGHQGLSFPQPHPGRRGRRRSRPAGRRPARRRAQLPADPPGLRPRRPRREAGPRPRPDPRSLGAR